MFAIAAQLTMPSGGLASEPGEAPVRMDRIKSAVKLKYSPVNSPVVNFNCTYHGGVSLLQAVKWLDCRLSLAAVEVIERLNSAASYAIRLLKGPPAHLPEEREVIFSATVEAPTA
jgi:hypothetical protein